METTITEALSEINLLKKKITEKEAFTKNLLFSQSHLPDAYQKHGGAAKVLTGEQQALNDLRKRLVTLKSAISKANIENTLEIDGEKKTIYDWLTWKREVYAGQIAYERDTAKRVMDLDSLEKNRPQVYTDAENKQHLVTFTRNLDLADAQKRIEKIEETHGKLDGLLSLKNATIKINLN